MERGTEAALSLVLWDKMESIVPGEELIVCRSDE